MREFDYLLDEAAASTLKQILGEGPADALLYHAGAKPSELGGKPFAEGLTRITGSGAVVIERLILKSFYAELGVRYEEGHGAFSFGKGIRRARELEAEGGRLP